MNKHNQLLTVLDDVFGSNEKIKSQFQKIRQGFDEKTNEHVVDRISVSTKMNHPGFSGG